MIKCKATKPFTLEEFDKLKNIKRAKETNNKKGKLYSGDTFECSKKMADYLMGKNPKKHIVAKVIEIEPKV